MNKILITDLENYNKLDLTPYKEVKVLLYGTFTGNIQELNQKHLNQNIVFISSEHYYNKIYDVMGEFIKQEAGQNLVLMGHYKLIALKLFDLFFLKVIIGKYSKNNIILKTKLDFDIKELYKEDNLEFISKPKRNYKLFFKSILALVFLLCKSVFALTFGNLINKKEKYDILFSDYEKKNIIKYYLSKFKNHKFEDLYFNFPLIIQKISVRNFILLVKYSLEILLKTSKYNFSFSLSYISIGNILKYGVVSSKYDVKLMVGVMDSNMGYDFLYLFVKDTDTKLVCLSHQSHVYPFRVNYLSNPYHYYMTSSKYLSYIIEKSQYIDTKCQFINIGYNNYASDEFKIYKSKDIAKKYDLVFICDYYMTTWAINPFSRDMVRQIAQTLLVLSKDYKILIRPRKKDLYYQDIYDVVGDNATYSLGDNRPSIYEDIKSAKLGMAAYTNGIKDGLLMNIPFLHFNYQNLNTTYIDILNDNLLYMSKNKEESIIKVNDFFENKLEKINFTKVNKKYMDNGEYKMNKVISVIESELN